MTEGRCHDSHTPRAVKEIDFDTMPTGCRSRLALELVHDALGNPIAVPVVVARGLKKGPVFGVTAAVHGDELNGIQVIHRLIERLDLKKLRGTVLAVIVVNVPGYLAQERTFPDGTDLNHILPGKKDGSIAQVYGHRLVKRVLDHCDFLVDLHTASLGRTNSLYVRADMSNAVSARMAYLQRPQIILNDPPSDHTLRGVAALRGIPAITLEINNPRRFQSEPVKRALVGLRHVLAEVGMLAKRPVSPGEAAVLCESSEWIYTDHGGLLQVFPEVTDYVHEGEVIARLSNIFGDVVREYRAPFTGVVIGKSVNPVGQTGARILHLGVVDEAHRHRFIEKEPSDARPVH